MCACGRESSSRFEDVTLEDWMRCGSDDDDGGDGDDSGGGDDIEDEAHVIVAA